MSSETSAIPPAEPAVAASEPQDSPHVEPITQVMARAVRSEAHNVPPEDGERMIEISVQKCGPDGEGGYWTPYMTTVIYHPGSAFESAMAGMCNRPQLIPLIAAPDYDSVADSCEHPSPWLLIFGSGFSREALNKFFARGFSRMAIVTRDAAPYMNESVPYDSRLTVMQPDAIGDCNMIGGNLTAAYLFEFFMSGEFPAFKSDYGANVNAANAKFLCDAIFSKYGSIATGVLQLCNMFGGIGTIDELIIAGRARYELRESIANKRLKRGVVFMAESYNVYAVNSDDVTADLRELGPMYPRVVKDDADYLLLYSMLGAKQWRLEFLPLKPTVLPTDQLIKKLTGAEPDHPNVAITNDAAKLLPFLC